MTWNRKEMLTYFDFLNFTGVRQLLEGHQDVQIHRQLAGPNQMDVFTDLLETSVGNFHVQW